MFLSAPSPGARPESVGAAAMLALMKDEQLRTRADLASATGLGRSTVNLRLETLRELGLVTPVQDGLSTGGRPPGRFAFNPEARVVLAVDLGATQAHVAVTDLCARILVERAARRSIGDGPERVLAWVVDTARQLLAEVERGPDGVAGVGVGLPGPVEHSSGRPVNPPIMPGWDDFDVAGWLRERLGAVVLVDNDVNVMAVGEHHARWSKVGHLLFVKVATGIGAGLIIDGRINRGARGAAGDLGHTRLAQSTEAVCRCGKVGCLEAVASGGAIAAALTRAGTPARDTGDVVRLVQAGDAEAVRRVRQAGRDLGEVLATCVNLLNPSVLVIGGRLAEAEEDLLTGVREAVSHSSLPLATQDLRIVAGQSGTRAGVTGAAVMVLDHVHSPEVLDALG